MEEVFSKISYSILYTFTMLSRALKKPDAYAEVWRGIAEVSFAVLFIGSLLEPDSSVGIVLAGFIGATIAWSLSIYFAKD